MKRELANIRSKTFNINKHLRTLPLDEPLRQEIQESILQIEQSVDKLKLPPMPGNSKEAEQFMPDAPVCPDKLIRRVCNEYRAKFPRIRITEEPNCGEALARLHELWFERILRHLLHNASRAVTQREDPLIFVRSRRTKNDIQVDVIDNGHGITEGVAPILFREPTPASEERSGHGLLIFRFLLELHGGCVQVGWNKPGQGACFYFTVPHLPAQERE